MDKFSKTQPVTVSLYKKSHYNLQNFHRSCTEDIDDKDKVLSFFFSLQYLRYLEYVEQYIMYVIFL